MALFKEYEVIKILEIMAESSFDELHLEIGDLKLIAKICADNAQMVEFKQTLFLVKEVSEKRASKRGKAR